MAVTMGFKAVHRRRTDVDLGLTRRQLGVLEAIHWWGGQWVRPMDVGGRNASHHSATLNWLVRRGLVEAKARSAGVRGSRIYRITEAGAAAVDSLWEDVTRAR